MSLLLSCQSLSKSHGTRFLFQNVSFGIFRGDKIGLIGPNGSGKSTLLKILASLDSPDSGIVSYKKSLHIGYVPQTSTYPDLSLEELLMSGFPFESSEEIFYERQTRIRALLSKLGFQDPLQNTQTLSGGWKKRLDIAKELVKNPDLLLLDEPTNHLDLEGILWLEQFLQRESFAFLITSHDRYFLQNIATKMMELNPIYPEGIFSFEGNYTSFLEKREEFFEYQQQRQRTLTSKVRSETEWLKQTPKARTTKAQARVQEAHRLIGELSEIKARHKQTSTKIDFVSTERQTKKLLAVKNVSKSIAGRLLFSHVTFTLYPGMRLGIVGANGTGKSTLLKLLAGEIAPDAGTIKHAEGLRIVYFDQYRQKLPQDITLRRALAPESDTVIYRGQSIHVNSWGKRFLFAPERLDLPVSQLSGGEKARVLIARLMLQPADLLLLDEPTNDLDIPTLETLEESLLDFPGALALITHDRAMLDRVATSVIGLGIVGECPLFADYAQWEVFLSKHQFPPAAKKIEEKKTRPITLPVSKKLSYQEKRELEQIEGKILALEKEIESLHQQIHHFTESNVPDELTKACVSLDTAQNELEKLYHRWQELENKSLET
jgi:ABC transport system ATP-binding/permease protein